MPGAASSLARYGYACGRSRLSQSLRGVRYYICCFTRRRLTCTTRSIRDTTHSRWMFLALSLERGWFHSLGRRVRSISSLPLVTLGLIWLSRHYGSPAYDYSIGMTVDAVLIAVFMIQMLGLSASPLWSWLNHPVTRWLGLIAYPSYLYHVWGLSVGERLLPHAPKSLTFAVGYAATLCFAWGSFRLVERPFLLIKDRLSHSPPIVDGAAAIPSV